MPLSLAKTAKRIEGGLQGDQIRVGAERLGSSLDGGGFGLTGDLDVRGSRFAVQSRRVGVGLGLGADGVRFRGRLRDRDLRLNCFALGVLLQLLHLDFGQHALLDRMQIVGGKLDILQSHALDDNHRIVFQRIGDGRSDNEENF